jgi:hypothetical protein
MAKDATITVVAATRGVRAKLISRDEELSESGLVGVVWS